MGDFAEYLNKKYGGGSDTTPSNTNNDFAGYLERKYGNTDAPVTSSTVSTGTESNWMKDLLPVIPKPTESPNFTENKVIADYEKIPDYNFVERLFSKEKSKAYDQKQAMYPEYQKAKYQQTEAFVKDKGISDSTLGMLIGGGMSSGMYTTAYKQLQNMGLSKDEIADVYDYAQNYYKDKAEEQIAEETTKAPVGMNALGLVTNPFESFGETVANGVNYVTGKPIKDNYTNITNTVRGTTNENIVNNANTEWGGKVGSTLYNAGMSIGDEVTALAIQLITGIPASAIQGFEKASGVTESAIERGLTPKQIMLESAVSGVLTTYLTEKYGVGSLDKNFKNIIENGIGNATGKEIAKYIGAQMVSEGSQEMAEDVADMIADGLIAWDKNEIKTDIDKLVANGETTKDATLKVLGNKVIEILLDGAIGGLSGGLMAGGDVGIHYGGYTLNKANNELNNLNFGNLTPQTDAEIKAEQDRQIARAEAKRNARFQEEQSATQGTDLTSLIEQYDVDKARENRFAEEQNANSIPNIADMIAEQQATDEANRQAEQERFDRLVENFATDVAIQDATTKGYGVEGYQYQTFMGAINSYRNYLATGRVSELNSAKRAARLVNNPDARAFLETVLNGGDLSVFENQQTTEEIPAESPRLDLPNYERVGLRDIPSPNDWVVQPREFVSDEDVLDNDRVILDMLQTPDPVEPTKPSRTRNVTTQTPVAPETNTTTTENIAPVTNANAEGGEYVNPNTSEFKENAYNNRTVYKTEIPDTVLGELQTQLYAVAKNVDTKAEADRIIETSSLDDALTTFDQMLRKKNPVAIPLGVALAQRVTPQQAVDIVERMSTELTKAGQFSQAAAIGLLKSNPIAALKYMQKQISKLNEEGHAKYGKKWTDFELSETEIKALQNIKPGDEESIQKMYDQITDRISKSYPSSMWERVVEARKLAMMFAPATHLRNVAANSVMVPVSSLTDRVEALGQHAYKLLSNDADYTPTQSLIGGNKAQKQVASKIFAEKVLPKLEGQNEYSEISMKQRTERGKQVFKDSAIGRAGKSATLKISRMLNNLTGGRLQNLVDNLDASMTDSVMENLKDLDYWLLGEVEDNPFVKRRFVNRLASYMAAQNITNEADIPQEAIDIAFDEALKATFKDQNVLTRTFSSIKKNMGKFGDVLLPFTMTPANIAMRGLEYSPFGLAYTLASEIKKNGSDGLTNALKTPEFAKGLVGSAGILAGFLLAQAGIIKGALSDDKDEKAFEQQQGQMAYSVKVGDSYYTFDWAQPAAIPLIIGTAISDKIADDDKDTLSILRQSGVAAIDAWANLSPLTSLQKLFDGDSLGDNLIQTITDFPSSFIPALSGATARTVDTNYRETYDKTSTGKTFVNQMKAKIPGMSDDLPSQYDTWGRERLRQADTGSAAFAQFLNPGKLGYNASTPIDSTIQELFDKTGDAKVFPQKAPYDFTKDGKKTTLNNEQHSELQKRMGELSYELAESFINSNYYKMVNDSTRADVLNTLYNYAKNKAEADMFNLELSTSDKKIANMYKENGANGVISYIATKNAIKESVGSSTKQEDVIPALGNLDISDSAKGEYLADALTLTAKAKEYASNGEYDKVYSYYDMKTKADLNHNGALVQDELVTYLRSSDLPLADKVEWFKTFYPDTKKIPTLY